MNFNNCYSVGLPVTKNNFEFHDYSTPIKTTKPFAEIAKGFANNLSELVELAN